MRRAARVVFAGMLVLLLLVCVPEALARVVRAEDAVAGRADGGAVVVTTGRPVRLRVLVRPVRGVQLRVRPAGCRPRSRLVAVAGGARQSFRLTSGRRALHWPVELAAGRRAIDLRVRGGRSCRVGVDELLLREEVVLGTAIEDRHLGDPRYALTAGRYTGATAENAMKMERLQPRQGRFDFAAADRVVRFAQRHGQEVHGHALVWGGQLPGWLRRGLLQRPWTREELRGVLRRHIQTVVGRYRGQVASWDVVNEAVGPTGRLVPNLWLRVIGPGYIEDAFRWAHEADPGARLYYNEVGIETATPNADAVLELLRDLRARGVPVHGVGFQAHLVALRAPPLPAVTYNVGRFAGAGLEVAFSELDVSTSGLVEPIRTALHTRAYETIARACEQQPRCRRVTVWGVSDAVSWLGPLQAGLPFDVEYRAKPAWCALGRRLQHRRCG